MFIGKYELNGTKYIAIYYKNKEGYDEWFKDTFSPEIENVEILDFKISGKSYE